LDDYLEYDLIMGEDSDSESEAKEDDEQVNSKQQSSAYASSYTTKTTLGQESEKGMNLGCLIWFVLLIFIPLLSGFIRLLG